MPHWADKGRRRVFSSFQPNGHKGWCHHGQSSTPVLSTVFQPVGIMIGTSVGLGIAWTDSGYRDGGGEPGWQESTITLWEACRGGPLEKKEPSRFSTLTQNQCLNLQRLKTCHYTIRKDTRIAGQPQPMPVLHKLLPQTQEGEIKWKGNSWETIRKGNTAGSVGSFCTLPTFPFGGFYIVVVVTNK